MNVYAQIPNLENEMFISADILCNDPLNGFDLYFGKNSGELFETGFGFFGRSGCIFDSDGFFFGGYNSGRRINISSHVFGDGRVSYFYNGKLINNDLTLASQIIDNVEFNKNNGSSAFFSVTAKERDIDEGAILYNGDAILYNGDFILY